VQAVVLPISNKFDQYAQQVVAELTAAGFRAELDNRNEKIQARIRDSELQKIPYMAVVGGKEAEARTVSVRHHGKGDLGPRPLAALLADMRSEVDSHTVYSAGLSPTAASPSPTSS
jgi:threonyl-tRNA synthetase